MEAYKMNLKKIDLESADMRQKLIIEDATKKNGGWPNMYGNMINSTGLLETYLHGYNMFRTESGFTPVEQEVIFLTLSYENECNYCMAAHSFIADKMSKVPTEVTDAIRAGLPIADNKLQVLSLFTKQLFISRGRPTKEEVSIFLAAGFDEKKILEIILALAVKTLSNYSNHVFDTETDDMFKGRTWTK